MRSSPDLRSGLTREQLETIDRFEADFNAIDHFLRTELRASHGQSFSSIVLDYRRRHRGWRDADLLREIADLRNAIVHGKTEPSGYLAVPSPALMKILARCRDDLTHPALAIPAFRKQVDSVDAGESLTSVLKRIAMRDYSQFPVYAEGRFAGLLTENGITRWLARRASAADSLVEFDDVEVSAVARVEEHRVNYAFVGRDMRADDLCALFWQNELLEAVLITHSGKESESLLGIATRWDASAFASRRE